jgi:tetratricopeptide (TPR) repeat protein
LIFRVLKTLETEFSKVLVSFKPGEKKHSPVNLSDAGRFSSLLKIDKPLKKDPSVPGVKKEPALAFKTLNIKNYITTANIFTAAGLAILLLFIIVLLRFSSLLKTEVETLKKDSKKNYAEALIKSGEIEKAKRILEELSHRKPVFADVLNSLGLILMEEGDYCAAEKKFKEALNINPKYSRAEINYAKALFHNNRHDESLEITLKLLSRYDDYADLHNLAAEIYMIRDEKEEALRHIKRSLKINPEYARALSNLEKLNNES